MALTPKQLAQKRLSRIDGLTSSYTRNLESVAQTFQRKLEQLLSSYNGNYAAIDVAAARAQITGLLMDSGYYEVVNDLLGPGYQALLDGSLADYSAYLGESLSFHEVSLARLEKLREAKFLDWTTIADDRVNAMQKIMMNVSFGSQTIDQAIEAIDGEIKDSFEQHGKTWIETSLSGWAQEESNVLASDAGLNDFQYVGPDDALTRPFCQEHLNEIKTLEEWRALDNGTELPVDQYCAGWGCRHQLIAVLGPKGND